MFYERVRDEYYLSPFFKDFNETGSFILKGGHGGIDFEVYMLDSHFDNDDNEYKKIKLHRLINMNNSTDYQGSSPLEDREVPL